MEPDPPKCTVHYQPAAYLCTSQQQQIQFCCPKCLEQQSYPYIQNIRDLKQILETSIENYHQSISFPSPNQFNALLSSSIKEIQAILNKQYIQIEENGQMISTYIYDIQYMRTFKRNIERINVTSKINQQKKRQNVAQWQKIIPYLKHASYWIKQVVKQLKQSSVEADYPLQDPRRLITSNPRLNQIILLMERHDLAHDESLRQIYALNGRFKNQNWEIKQKLAHLQKQNKELATQLDSRVKGYISIQSELKKSKSQYKNIIAAVSDENIKTSKKLKHTELLLKNKQEEIVSQLQSFSSFKQSSSLIEQQVSYLKQKNTELAGIVENQKKQSYKLRQDLAKNDQMVRTYKQKIQNLSSNLANKQTEYQNSLKTKNNALKKAEQSLQTQNKQYKINLKEKDRIIQQQRSEKESLLRQKSQLTNLISHKINELRMRQDQYQNQIAALQKQKEQIIKDQRQKEEFYKSKQYSELLKSSKHTYEIKYQDQNQQVTPNQILPENSYQQIQTQIQKTDKPIEISHKRQMRSQNLIIESESDKESNYQKEEFQPEQQSRQKYQPLEKQNIPNVQSKQHQQLDQVQENRNIIQEQDYVEQRQPQTEAQTLPNVQPEQSNNPENQQFQIQKNQTSQLNSIPIYPKQQNVDVVAENKTTSNENQKQEHLKTTEEEKLKFLEDDVHDVHDVHESQIKNETDQLPKQSPNNKKKNKNKKNKKSKSKMNEQPSLNLEKADDQPKIQSQNGFNLQQSQKIVSPKTGNVFQSKDKLLISEKPQNQIDNSQVFKLKSQSKQLTQKPFEQSRIITEIDQKDRLINFLQQKQVGFQKIKALENPQTCQDLKIIFESSKVLILVKANDDSIVGLYSESSLQTASKLEKPELFVFNLTKNKVFQISIKSINQTQGGIILDLMFGETANSLDCELKLDFSQKREERLHIYKKNPETDQQEVRTSENMQVFKLISKQ